MDPALFLTSLIAALMVLFALGVPIFVAFLVCNIMAIVLLVGDAGIGMFANSLFNSATSIPLVTLPLFILMGEILSRANAIESLMSAVNTLVSGLKGRLYFLTVIISTILAALSGSAMASAAMLGRSVVPEMIGRGYDKPMTLGAAMGGACLAPIIPPSILAILVGTLAQISIGKLFQAGIVPGVLIAGLFVLYIMVRVVLNPDLAPPQEERAPRSARDVLGAIGALLPFFTVIGFVMGSIITGLATPSESAAIGVLGSLGVAAIFRRFSIALFVDALRSTARLTAMIMVILISSQLFSQLLAFSGTSAFLREFVTGLEWSPTLMLILMLLVPLVLCMFMDEIAVMLILIPIYLPLLGPLGFDPLWFFTLFLVNLSLGAITPPVGYVLYILQGVTKGVSLREVFSASIPYCFIFVTALAVIGAFPTLITGFAD